MRRNSPSEPPLVFEPEDLQIETTDGRRLAGTAGDRMMVGLAALALLGGALIAITNALPDDPQMSRASASADGSEAVASRTLRPTPSPPPQRTTQVVVEALPSPEPVQQRYEGWVRALELVRLGLI